MASGGAVSSLVGGEASSWAVGKVSLMPPKTWMTPEQVADSLDVRRREWVECTGISLLVQSASFYERKNKNPGANHDLARRSAQ